MHSKKNAKAVSAKLQSAKIRRTSTYLLRTLLGMAVILLILITVALAGSIIIGGVSNLRLSLFAWEYTPENVSMMPAIINTVLMTVLSLAVAVPIGVFSAVYLVEYAKKGSKVVRLIRMTTETLSGIPSIVYGLFGFLCFVITLGWDYSLLAGVFTLAIMILPLIMRTTEEALLSVPDAYREASFGLGAGKLRTVFLVVLPNAVSGILAGVILAIGRIVGESAALIYTAGTVPETPDNLFSSVRTLSVHMYALFSEGLYTREAYATSFVLLFLVAGINALSHKLASTLIRR